MPRWDSPTKIDDKKKGQSKKAVEESPNSSPKLNKRNLLRDLMDSPPLIESPGIVQDRVNQLQQLSIEESSSSQYNLRSGPKARVLPPTKVYRTRSITSKEPVLQRSLSDFAVTRSPVFKSLPLGTQEYRNAEEAQVSSVSSWEETPENITTPITTNPLFSKDQNPRRTTSLSLYSPTVGEIFTWTPLPNRPRVQGVPTSGILPSPPLNPIPSTMARTTVRYEPFDGSSRKDSEMYMREFEAKANLITRGPMLSKRTSLGV